MSHIQGTIHKWAPPVRSKPIIHMEMQSRSASHWVLFLALVNPWYHAPHGHDYYYYYLSCPNCATLLSWPSSLEYEDGHYLKKWYDMNHSQEQLVSNKPCHRLFSGMMVFALYKAVVSHDSWECRGHGGQRLWEADRKSGKKARNATKDKVRLSTPPVKAPYSPPFRHPLTTRNQPYLLVTGDFLGCSYNVLQCRVLGFPLFVLSFKALKKVKCRFFFLKETNHSVLESWECKKWLHTKQCRMELFVLYCTESTAL